MGRWLRVGFASLGLAWAGPALADGIEPWMWGIGANLGTVAVPGQYPLAFPSKINNYDFIDSGPRAGDDNSDEPKRDLDANGNPRFTSLQRVKGDVRFGIDGFYGIDKDNRIGASAFYAGGGGYSDMSLLLNYDRVLVNEKPFWVLGGLGLGVGTQTFKGTDETIQGFENELLKVPYFPIKGRVAGHFHTDNLAFGPSAFVQVGIPSNHFYTDLQGKEQTIQSPLNFVNYLAGGIQFEFQYGDFTPPKKKKPPAKKKPGGKKPANGGKKPANGGKPKPKHP